MKIDELKKLNIWSEYIKIKDFVERTYIFKLKESKITFYVIEDIMSFWKGPSGKELFLEDIFDVINEETKEIIVLNMDLFV